MRIAICEDEKSHSDILQASINAWANKQPFRVSTTIFESAEQFIMLTDEPSEYDILFIDIRLKKMDGMTLARKIRSEKNDVLIIFTSGLKEQIAKGYEVFAFRFLVKPIQTDLLEKTLDDAEKYLRNAVPQILLISKNGEYIKIPKKDILYLEARNHYITINTTHEVLKVKANIYEYENLLMPPWFCRCHRSFIVNLGYVQKISKAGLMLDSGLLIPVSRKLWEETNQCFMRYYGL